MPTGFELAVVLGICNNYHREEASEAASQRIRMDADAKKMVGVHPVPSSDLSSKSSEQPPRRQHQGSACSVLVFIASLVNFFCVIVFVLVSGTVLLQSPSATGVFEALLALVVVLITWNNHETLDRRSGAQSKFLRLSVRFFRISNITLTALQAVLVVWGIVVHRIGRQHTE